MKITDTQAAMLNIQLANLGQTPLSGTDRETLQALEYLLEAALKNVRAALEKDDAR